MRRLGGISVLVKGGKLRVYLLDFFDMCAEKERLEGSLPRLPKLVKRQSRGALLDREKEH